MEARIQLPHALQWVATYGCTGAYTTPLDSPICFLLQAFKAWFLCCHQTSSMRTFYLNNDAGFLPFKKYPSMSNEQDAKDLESRTMLADIMVEVT